jgi:DNA repair protein RadA/Sms
LYEAAKLGFSIALLPKSNLQKQKIEGLQVIGVERIDEAMAKVRELA